MLLGVNPLVENNDGITALKQAKRIVKLEIESYLDNPIRYRSNHSALIAVSIGLASLDWPVLVVELISDYLVSINEETLFGQYSEQKNWTIASLIKNKAKEN